MAVEYESDDITYVIDSGIHVPCPDCGTDEKLDWILSHGCYTCGRDPWTVTLIHDNQ